MTAMILAGGKSSRMGKDKALLPFGDHTVLENLTHTVTPLFEETIVIVDCDSKLEGLDLKGASVSEDIIKNRGPLAGIYSGFCDSKKGAGCVFTCDMPLVNEKLIRELAEAWESDLDVLCFQDEEGGLEPFPGIYSKQSRLLIRSVLDNGDGSMQQYLSVANMKSLTLTQENAGVFMNMNTMEDYHAALNHKGLEA